MPSTSTVDPSNALGQAFRKARDYKWIEAADLARQALKDIEPQGDTSSIGHITEFSATCYFKAAFQAVDRAKFKELMTASKTAFERAGSLYASSRQSEFTHRALARSKTADFWMSDDPNERLLIGRQAADLFLESARLFQSLGKPRDALETQTELLAFIKEFVNLCTDFASLKSTFDQALSLGRTTINGLKLNPNLKLLIQVLSSMIWYLAVEAEIVLPTSEFQSLANEIRAFETDLEQAAQSDRTALASYLAKESLGHITFDLDGDATLALANYEESLRTATALTDSLAIGRLQWLCAQSSFWLGYTENDPVRKRVLYEKGMRFALDSIRNLAISFQTTELSASYTVLARCLVGLANLVGADLEQKKDLLNEAAGFASKGVQLETATWGWSRATNALANVLYFLSRIETRERKARLLQEALNAREQIVKVNDQLSPNFWNNVIAPYNLALVRSEIADLQEDVEVKNRLLTQATSEMELCLGRGQNWRTNPGFLYRIADHNEAYGDILSKQYRLARDSPTAQKALNAYEKAVSGFEQSKSTTNIAALKWKVARIYDDLRSFQRAAEEFKSAAIAYRRAVAEIPGSASLFEDLARYLDAWSIIESARIHHDDGEYHSAYESYSAASRLLEDSKEWSYLSQLFFSRSLLEKGEGQSAEEKHSDAVQSFKAAIDQFRKETELLEKKLLQSGIEEDRRELERWLEIARQRESYCRARQELEEARVLDEKGDKTGSARKFRTASEKLTSLSSKVSDNQERMELEGLARFCEGWALMKEAESQASPETYADAAEAFLRLRSTLTKGQFLQLALANAAICKALGAGTIFQQTRDAQHYSEVKRQTEAAADYFRQAGFRKTEAWTRATQRLYDALIFITDAESERNPARKTELYHLAENHLRLAARLYDEAGFPAKREEATSQLERVREEKRVLLAPLEALSEIPTATAASLSLSPRGRGQPLEPQRFDEAYVVGDLNIPHREVPLGSTFTIDLEIANVGKSPAMLVKLQDVLPEGLEPIDERGVHISSDGKLELLGRTLEHLKTHVVKIQTKAARRGEVEFRPRLFYSDDSGNYKTYQFQPAHLTVLDVDSQTKPISATPIPTPAVISLGADFRFETDRSREVFQSLVSEFLVDYMTKRIYVEKAGWRSLVQIVKETEIPRSSLYGPRGRDGPVLVELERRGLVESRIFPKERGRGGAVKKIRVAYDNDVVKKIVERAVLDNTNP